MLNQFFAIFMVSVLCASLCACKAIADTLSASTPNIELVSNQRIGVDRRLPDGADIYKTSFHKIEFLTSQVAGLGHGRPGTEEFLNADIIVKLKEDSNIYGFSLTFFDENGPSKAMFDTLMAALVYDLSVEIVYYEKAGTKQMIKVTVKK